MATLANRINRVTGVTRQNVTTSRRNAFRKNVRNRYRRKSAGGAGG